MCVCVCVSVYSKPKPYSFLCSCVSMCPSVCPSLYVHVCVCVCVCVCVFLKMIDCGHECTHCLTKSLKYSICSHDISAIPMGGCFHLPTEPPVAALPGSHLKKNWGWHILIEIDAHIWKKIPKKVNFAAITALLEIGRWYHPPIGSSN